MVKAKRVTCNRANQCWAWHFRCTCTSMYCGVHESEPREKQSKTRVKLCHCQSYRYSSISIGCGFFCVCAFDRHLSQQTFPALRNLITSITRYHSLAFVGWRVTAGKGRRESAALFEIEATWSLEENVEWLKNHDESHRMLIKCSTFHSHQINILRTCWTHTHTHTY